MLKRKKRSRELDGEIHVTDKNMGNNSTSMVPDQSIKHEKHQLEGVSQCTDRTNIEPHFLKACPGRCNTRVFWPRSTCREMRKIVV